MKIILNSFKALNNILTELIVTLKAKMPHRFAIVFHAAFA